VPDAITTFIADDQAMVRQGFGALLSAQPDISVVGDAANGRDAVRLVASLAPDVVLMDVRMPELNGLDAAREILARHTGTKVLMLTTFDIDDYVYAALRAGASGFLLKDAPADELVRAVRRRSRRRPTRTVDHAVNDRRPGEQARRTAPVDRRARTPHHPRDRGA
jgi:DNA-binding NarL/FixJ family response regulator